MDGLAEPSEVGLRAGCALQTSKNADATRYFCKRHPFLQTPPLHVRHADQSFLFVIGLSSARDLASKMRK
jgi:hypothetical protein